MERTVTGEHEALRMALGQLPTDAQQRLLVKLETGEPVAMCGAVFVGGVG